MYEKNGLTLGDLYRKCKEVLKTAPDDTPIWLVLPGGDESYAVNSIGVTGITIKDPEDEDKPNGCPTGLELITEDTISESDVYAALEAIDDKDFIIDYIVRHDDILDSILEMYGGKRW